MRNIVAAVRITGWKHIPCFAHILNLIVQYRLVSVKDLVNRVKVIVEFFRRSTQATAKLKAMQAQLGEASLNLKQDMVTRWNSTYDMLKRIIILLVKNSLMSVVAINYPQLNNITNEDITLIDEICDLFKVFKDCTEEMNSEKQVTLSKVILLQHAMKNWCTRVQNKAETKDEVRTMAERLLETLNNKFRNIQDNQIIAQATFSDPTCKKQGFSDDRFF